jgi:hypothetical protein
MKAGATRTLPKTRCGRKPLSTFLPKDGKALLYAALVA